jgi:glycosyltransferase involved in cell wall biosynthesis
MRILLINKYHFLKGGAERAYFDMARMLTERGHEVAFFSMQHPSNQPTPWEKYFVENAEYQDEHQSLCKKLALAAKIIYSFEAKRDLEKLLDEFRPDVAHVHNIYHQLSPSIFAPLKRRGIPIVMTLHDYKLVSSNYSLFVRGKIWEHASGWRCIMDRCVKDSYMKSLVCALEKWLHALLGSYAKVDAFVAPSRFLITKFSELGFSRPIAYLPNPLMPPATVSSVERERDAFLFFGRLSIEKGVETLIEAFASLPEKRLWIVGDGPERLYLEELVTKRGMAERVKFFGTLYGDDLEALKQRAQAIILPSVWYENFPYALIESLQSGAVVIASDLGGMPERIQHGQNGLLFEAGNAEALAEAVRSLDTLPLDVMHERAKESVADLTEEAFMAQLIPLYESLIAGKGR